MLLVENCVQWNFHLAEVSALTALTRLAFYENLLIGGEKVVIVCFNGRPYKQVKFREKVRAFSRDKENCLQ